MDKPERNADGTFPKGVSGNPHGRPSSKALKGHRLPVQNRRAAIEVAEMPVTISMDGKAIEVSAYRAVLLSLLKKALSNHGPSIKLFLEHMERTVAVHGQQTEFAQYMVGEYARLQGEMDGMEGFFTKQLGGVHTQMPDGTIVPGSWYDKLMQLKEMDKREAELKKREQRLALLEARLDPKPE